MIDFVASDRNYVDHLIGIWRALEHSGQRGMFYLTHRGYEQALALGVDPRDVRASSPPTSSSNLLVTAAFGDIQRNRRIVLVEHGAGQHYIPAMGSKINESYAGGISRDAVVLFICPNEIVAERNRVAYPNTPALVTGSPRVDDLMAIRASAVPAPDTIALAWHWPCAVQPESRTAMPHYLPAFPKLVAEFPNVLGHCHPRFWDYAERRYRQSGITPVKQWPDVITQATVVAVDNSSVLYEAVALGIPVVVMDAPWYRRNVHHGLRFWTHADVGPRIGHPNELIPALYRAVDEFGSFASARQAAITDTFPLQDGMAARRAADAILEIANG